MFCASCSTYTKFNVAGQPGTKIYNSQGNELATIDASGQARLTLSDEYYHDFLLAIEPGSKNAVPFALDYKHRSTSGAAFSAGTGFGLLSLGAAGLFPCVVFACIGEPVIALNGLVATCGMTGIGAGIYGPAQERLNQDSYFYRYKYLPRQRTNNDMVFTQPVFNAYKSNSYAVKTGSTSLSKESSTSRPQMASRSLKDNAAIVEGDYNGHGSLIHNGAEVEFYNDVSIILIKSGRNKVLVRFLESGIDYFDGDSEFVVTKSSNGSYSLSADNSAVQITIDESGVMEYTHSSVQIDDSIFVLTANVKK